MRRKEERSKQGQNKQQGKATQHTQGSHFFKEKWAASGGTQIHDTLHSRQSALPLSYQGSFSWLGPNLTSHNAPDEQCAGLLHANSIAIITLLTHSGSRRGRRVYFPSMCGFSHCNQLHNHTCHKNVYFAKNFLFPQRLFTNYRSTYQECYTYSIETVIYNIIYPSKYVYIYIYTCILVVYKHIHIHALCHNKVYFFKNMFSLLNACLLFTNYHNI